LFLLFEITFNTINKDIFNINPHPYAKHVNNEFAINPKINVIIL